MILSVIPPYNFHLSTSIYTHFACQAVDYCVGGRYRRILRDGKQIYLTESEYSGDVDNPSIEVRLLQPEAPTLSAPLARRIQWILGLDYDLTIFYKTMDEESRTRQLKNSLYGLKPLRSASIFEALVIAITEQRVSLAAALAVRERLAKRYGQAILYRGREYVEFPCPKSLATSHEKDLRALGFSSLKAKSIKTVAELVASGELDLESICKLPVEQVLAELTRIKGIGPWTVEYMLCRGAGRYDAVPANDIALKAGMKKWYGSDRVQSEDDVRSILSKFGAYSGYAAFYFIFSYAYEKYHPRLF